ncbi:MAG TPA: DUF4411 family protein [Candidatus Limnocylindrales bacterium]|nr:DUF4411 family protein [Candidatus Limnocylindrales bacterium]
MYVFDTSALVEAWVRLYPPRRFPALWENIDELINDERAVAPHEVLEELKAQDDDLLQWAKDRSDGFIRPTSRQVMLAARDVLEDHPKLTKPGKGRGKADPFVVALAETIDWTVVTQERGGTAEKPKIPYVCGERGVNCMSDLDIIDAEDWTF